MADIDDRLRKIEDRFELQDLVARYFVASDDDDLDALAAMFAPDGIFEGPGFSGGTNRDEVMDFVRAFRANVGSTIHTPHYQLIEFVDANRATGIVGAHIELAFGDETYVGAFRYYDIYAREEGRWRFARRELRTVHVGPWRDVGNSLTAERAIRWPGAEPEPTHFPKKAG